jgi:hypothetical protein
MKYVTNNGVVFFIVDSVEDKGCFSGMNNNFSLHGFEFPVDGGICFTFENYCKFAVNIN